MADIRWGKKSGYSIGPYGRPAGVSFFLAIFAGA